MPRPPLAEHSRHCPRKGMIQMDPFTVLGPQALDAELAYRREQLGIRRVRSVRRLRRAAR